MIWQQLLLTQQMMSRRMDVSNVRRMYLCRHGQTEFNRKGLVQVTRRRERVRSRVGKGRRMDTSINDVVRAMDREEVLG